MATNVAQIVLWPHTLTAGWYQSGFRFPAIGVHQFTGQKNCAIQLDAIETNAAAHLRLA